MDEVCQDQYSDLISTGSEVQKQNVSGLKFLSAINLGPLRNCIAGTKLPGYGLQ